MDKLGYLIKVDIFLLFFLFSRKVASRLANTTYIIILYKKYKTTQERGVINKDSSQVFSSAGF